MIKTARYNTDKGPIDVEYDSNAPCICCELPVIEASVSGPLICPWCDMGIDRQGHKLSLVELNRLAANQQKNGASAHDYLALMARVSN